MKKIFTIFYSLTLFVSLNAQTYDFDGVVWTDFDGVTHDLGQLQDDGYTIVIDFWATWCNPCLQSVPSLETLMEERGPLGDQTYMVFSVETDQTTNNEAEIIEQYGIGSPVIIEEDNLPSIIGSFDYGGSIPYFVTVCPDGTWSSVTGSVTNGPGPLLSSCSLPTSIVNDARVISGSIQSNFECPSTPYSLDFELKNIGTDPLTSAKIEVTVDGNVVETINWTGSLNKFDEEMIETSDIDFDGQGIQNVEFNVIEANGSADDNSLNNLVSFDKSFPFVESLDVTMEIDNDTYGAEIGFTLLDENGDEVYAVAEGTYANGSGADFTESITLPAFDACYDLTFTDGFGDGNLAGGWRLLDADGNILLERTDAYETIQNSKFYAVDDKDNDGANDFVENAAGSDPNDPNSTPATVASIKDVNLINEFTVLPNPVSDILNVELTAASDNDFSIELINVLGKVVSTNTTTNGKASFNVSSLSGGIYFVNVTDNGASVATSTVVVK